ncbi:MAG: chemotaxis protein CheA [Alphaproteobacteria bacterium]|nr:chemotaxis protein CheA [Alphaproteobacteria bacterium]
MEEFRQVFFTECAELLADMEARLLHLKEGVTDSEALNAIFRCAHSIKGGSGAFGLDHIMRFTHALEALLDKMRDGSLLPTRDSIDILLKSADIVTQMIDTARARGQIADDFGADVLARLKAATDGQTAIPAPKPQPAADAEVVEVGAATQSRYTISFRPHEELFASGNEPLLILRELARLGALEVTADLSRIPVLEELNPAQCFLGWTMELVSEAPIEAVQEVFEFVEDIADIRISQEVVEPAPAEWHQQIEEAQERVLERVADAAVAKAAEKAAEKGAEKTAAATSIRVDLEKVDRLVNMVGELVITEAMLRAQARHLPPEQFGDLMRGVDELSHHTRELQEAVMAVRMQPVKSIFSRMPRIVRDTAAQLGKDIQLVLSGENTEVDKTVIEQLGDPLTHMIRNSVDHGIETPDQRAWNDKPLEGTIHLSAYHRSGRIIIEISDDGAGINRSRVLSKAIEKGLVAPDAQLTDEEIDHLIFLPGFSTAETVTSVSGRGVGMDVVKRNIESLGGHVRVTNNPGKGSVFTVSLPLTLAILDGMIVRVGAENYIIPITSIIESLRPKAQEVHPVQGKSDVINVRGEFVPLVYLHRVFKVAGAEGDPSKALIVLVESGHQKMGLVVDELIGQQQVVIKSLEANADPVKGISGATILGDGKVSLILEINELKSLQPTHVKHPEAA